MDEKKISTTRIHKKKKISTTQPQDQGTTQRRNQQEPTQSCETETYTFFKKKQRHTLS